MYSIGIADCDSRKLKELFLCHVEAHTHIVVHVPGESVENREKGQTGTNAEEDKPTHA